MSAQLSVTVVVSREDDRFVAQCLEPLSEQRQS
jgi:hypothetical protein